MNCPLASVIPDALSRLPQAPAGDPLMVKLIGSLNIGPPLALVAVAVTAEVLAPSAEMLVGSAVTLTPAPGAKNPKRSTTTSVDPVGLKIETDPVELSVATTRFGIVCPALKFRSDASGRVPPG